MYELIILSLLMHSPMHGYLIARIINDIIGPYARISNGRLYPLLAKLEQGGQIELDEETCQEQHGERNPRPYHITEAGRKRFCELMMDTTSNPGEYQRIFRRKASVLSFLQPTERLYLINHYLNYCQTHVLHLTAEADDLRAGNFHQGQTDGREWLPATLDVMAHMADQWQLEAAWANRLREQELANQQKALSSSQHTGNAEHRDPS